MPIISKHLSILKEEDLGQHRILWMFTMIDTRLMLGVVSDNKRSVLCPLEIVGINKNGKILYVCILKKAGLNSVRVKVALNKSKVKSLHRFVILWLVENGLTVYCDRKLTPAGASVWKKLLSEKIAVASSDERIWHSERVTVRVPGNNQRYYFIGVPYGQST
jgi:hypothetical protein